MRDEALSFGSLARGRGADLPASRAQGCKHVPGVKTGASQPAAAAITPGKLLMAGSRLSKHAGTVRPLDARDPQRRRFAAAATEPAASIPQRRRPTTSPRARVATGAVR
jgi:hypothetical protein